MDPVPFYMWQDQPDRFEQMILSLSDGGPPVEVWHGGNKVAVIITPEEFDLLNRLIAQED